MKQKSLVYFTDMRTRIGLSLPAKLERLVKRAGIEKIDFDRKFVAIKIHFGELGNLSFLRPNYAKRIVDILKPLGAKPFLTDCNTLYPGSRKNALDHLDCAMENGFWPLSTGCQIIIGDGLKGTDETIVPLKGTDLVKEAKIGHAIMDADIIISLNHFKGHEATGFGGALKNLGMGCGSRAGKMEQHTSGKPRVNDAMCRKCKTCAKECGSDAIYYDESGVAHIDPEKCTGCGRCIGACNFDAIAPTTMHANEILSKKIAEYTLAVVQGRPQFHINIVTQVSPACDCHGENDTPIIPDVGMFASFDAVALDQACADACNRQPVLGGSELERMLKSSAKGGESKGGGAGGGVTVENVSGTGADHFTAVYASTNWRDTLAHAEKIGVGTRAYELVRV